MWTLKVFNSSEENKGIYLKSISCKRGPLVVDANKSFSSTLFEVNAVVNGNYELFTEEIWIMNDKD